MTLTENQSEFLLSIDELRPGDVLLTHGGEAFSKAIAKFGGGNYSHAALYIGGTMIYESDGETSIGLKPLKSFGTVNIDGKIISLVEAFGNPTRCSVLRHCQMAEISEKRFNEALEKLMRETHGMDYARLTELLEMANLPPPLEKISKWSFGIYDNHKAKKPGYIHGHFCSEIVAKLYENLGLRISRLTNNPAKLTGPFDFSKPGSLFHELHSVVIPKSEALPRLIPLDDGLSSLLQLEEGSAKLAAYAADSANAIARMSKHWNKSLDGVRTLRESLEELNRAAIEKTRQRLIRERDLLPELGRDILKAGHEGDMRRMMRLGDGFGSIEEALDESPSSVRTHEQNQLLARFQTLTVALVHTQSLFFSNLFKRAASAATDDWIGFTRLSYRHKRISVLLSARKSIRQIRRSRASLENELRVA